MCVICDLNVSDFVLEQNVNCQMLGCSIKINIVNKKDNDDDIFKLISSKSVMWQKLGSVSYISQTVLSQYLFFNILL